MHIDNKSRVHWACRRGMKELDIAMLSFFEYEYDGLNEEDKWEFARLLECDDPNLFSWLMNFGEPKDAQMKRMVQLIQMRNKDRGPVAM